MPLPLLVGAGQGSENPVFFKKNPANWVSWVLLGSGLCWVFRFFYLNKQFGSLLADLAHQLSFYLDLPIL